tara:strand:- start:821 stop:1015 length:195 start_codon:yes stop_codon:yes gene_type:complete
MKVGDLVKPGEEHGLRGESWRRHGLVIEYLPKNEDFRAAAIVRWNDGAVELEIPEWLEIVNENR